MATCEEVNRKALFLSAGRGPCRSVPERPKPSTLRILIEEIACAIHEHPIMRRAPSAQHKGWEC